MLKIKCYNENCDNEFVPKHKKHIYCCRKCFNDNKKLERKEIVKPEFICPECGDMSPLDFNPLNEPSKWLDYKCKKCGYRNNDNDYEEVEEIKKNRKNR